MAEYALLQFLELGAWKSKLAYTTDWQLELVLYSIKDNKQSLKIENIFLLFIEKKEIYCKLKLPA